LAGTRVSHTSLIASALVHSTGGEKKRPAQRLKRTPGALRLLA
jgi:hypothetical protein